LPPPPRRLLHQPAEIAARATPSTTLAANHHLVVRRAAVVSIPSVATEAPDDRATPWPEEGGPRPNLARERTRSPRRHWR
jgi:hypothetical protein